MKEREILEDEEGITDLPMKLLIMTVLIGAIVPAGIVSYRTVSRNRYESKVRTEIYRLFELAHDLSDEGNLSTAQLKFDLSGGIFARLDYLLIGDELDGLGWRVEYKLTWENSPSSIHAADHDIHLTSPSHTPLELKSELYDLSLTHMYTQGDSYILIEEK